MKAHANNATPAPRCGISQASSRLARIGADLGFFAEYFTFYAQGDMDSPQRVSGDVSWADEGGDNSVRGDGRSQLNGARGKRTRSTCVIEAPVDLPISENGRDLFKVNDPAGNDVIVSLHRRDGIDDVSQTLVCVLAKEHFAQPGRRDG